MEAEELYATRRRRLVSELRSGLWPQTRGALERLTATAIYPAGFCCLGVACQVAIADGATTARKVQGLDSNLRVIYTDSGSMLPNSAVDWYGFTQQDPDLKVPQRVWQDNAQLAGKVQLLIDENEPVQFSATALNDDYMLTLAQIADCFEYTFLREDWDARHGATGS